VGCRDDMRNAIVKGHLAHLLGNFPGARAIINERQHMAMNIDHADKPYAAVTLAISRNNKSPGKSRRSKNRNLDDAKG